MSHRIVKAAARLNLREVASGLRRSVDHWRSPRPFPDITVGRVTVRLLQLTDMEAWDRARLANEDRMGAWWPAVADWRTGNDDAVILRYYLERRASARGEAYALAIVGLDGLLGEISLWHMSRGGSTAEVGVWTKTDAVAGEELIAALAAAHDHLVFDMGFERLDAPVAHGNPHPVRLLAWLGFQHEGLLSRWRVVCEDLADYDLHGMTREPWLARRAEVYSVNPWPLSLHAPALT